MAVQYPRDYRCWRVVSDYFGTDSGPLTTRQIIDAAESFNNENPGGSQFRLAILETEIVDLNRQRGNEGHIVALRAAQGE